MRDELLQYNSLIKEYKEYYFNVYSFLIIKNWIEFEPDENSNNELWFDWLISPTLQAAIEISQDIYNIDIIQFENDKLDIEVSNCRSIIPCDCFVSSIDINSNVYDVISKYKKYRSNYNLKGQADIILINNNWYVIEVEDIQACDDDLHDINYITLYISPDLDREFIEAYITKHNVYDLLKYWPDYIVNSDIWWDYEE